jgi:hypothetical protein
MEEHGHLYTAKRANIVCGMIMRFAVATGLADIDPLPSLRGSMKAYKGKHLAAMTDPKDVGRLLRAIWSYPGSFVVPCALKIAPYVFVRPGELQQTPDGQRLILKLVNGVIPLQRPTLRTLSLWLHR